MRNIYDTGKENKCVLLSNNIVHITLLTCDLDYKYIHKRDRSNIFNVEVLVLNKNLMQSRKKFMKSSICGIYFFLFIYLVCEALALRPLLPYCASLG
jgi:hypothetical protein